LQVGIELYGHNGSGSDIEVLLLMIETLTSVGLKDFHIDLGHVGIFRSMARQAELSAAEEETLFDTLQRKAVTELSEFLSSLDISDEYKKQFLSLVDLNGDISVIDKARQILIGDDVQNELNNLEAIAKGLLAGVPDQKLYFDLSELRGYNYHTGVVFAAYLPGHGQEIAQGGRYDGIGEIFGRSRAATGFSSDLTHLVSLKNQSESTRLVEIVFAPAVQDAELMMAVSQLRQQGTRVICELANSNSNAQALGCTHTLSNDSGQWQVVDIKA
jgi:ATP phosphoribosyltransferase regulatory subunit